jgi:hypothetical protein
VQDVYAVCSMSVQYEYAVCSMQCAATVLSYAHTVSTVLPYAHTASIEGGGEEEENQQVEEVESKLHTLTAYLHCIDSVQFKDCSTIDS